MTTPQGDPLIADPGNPLLTKVPARLDTGQLASPMGQLAVLTIRTGSTTTTILLTADEVKDWSQRIGGLAGSMSQNGLIVVPPGQIGKMQS